MDSDVNLSYVWNRRKGVISGYNKHDYARFSGAWTQPSTSRVLGSRHDRIYE